MQPWRYTLRVSWPCTVILHIPQSAELLFNHEPRTCLSLVHPCTSQRLEQFAEILVGDKQPRTFTVNDKAIVCDLRPSALDRWRKVIVTKTLGPLNYEVSVDGRSCQAHVDHLCCIIPLEVSNPTPDNEPADCEPAESTAAHEVVPFVPLEVESSTRDSHGQELVTL